MTDFGEDDFFVPSLKGTLLKINPSARIVDITHHARSFDIKGASFILFSCYKYFPEKTIFLIVVDPGVGSYRKILLVETDSYYFIAPDNGILSLVLEEEKVRQIREITNKSFFLTHRGRTFEGRDKMAPVAASLSKGISCQEFGPKLKRYKKVEWKEPVARDKEISGHILYKDKFGNLISNIPEWMVGELQKRNKNKKLSLLIKGKEISLMSQSYSSVSRSELLFLVGSLGLIEVAAREDSAAARLNAEPGEKVKVVVRD